MTGEQSPCIGSLRCNPIHCSNAIITRDTHAPAWKKVFFENRRMARDPRFSYAKTELEHAANEAKEVLRVLGEEVDDEAAATV